MTNKVMKLIDEGTGLMRCKVCGREHYAAIIPDSGGKYTRASWQCRNECKMP